MNESARELGAWVVGACLERGFVRAGIAPAVVSEREREFAAWLAAGKQGEMRYLEEHLAERMDPRRLVEGARAVIMVADRYWVEKGQMAKGQRAKFGGDGEGELEGQVVGRIARYVRGGDYHAAIKRRLHGLADALRERFPGEVFRTVVDSAPVLEREHAARAGIGWVGKHTLVIDPRVGSYFLLGGIVTTLDLEAPEEQPPVRDHCGTCTRCIDACPTGAITPYSVDGSRCISYLTIEHRGVIDAGMHAGIGEWVFGCDVCQEVCPHNRVRAGRESGGVNEVYRPRREGLDLLAILGWDEEARRGVFTTSAMKRAKLEMMKRNALIAAGNVVLGRGVDAEEMRGIVERVRRLAGDEGEGEVVRETARQVLRRWEEGGK